MIRPWVAVLASFHNTPIFARIWVIVAAFAAYAGIVAVIELYFLTELVALGVGLHGFLGLILGMLLVFRTNTSYDRWWEGRKAWGQLVNDSRNLAIKVKTCVEADANEKRQIGQWLVDFAYALKGHLRGGVHLSELAGFSSSGDQPSHVPAYISSRIYEQLERWKQRSQLGGFELLFLDQHAASLMAICGACERIQKSPISTSYRWFIRQSIGIYLLTLPWGFAESFGYWMIPAVAMLAYFMIGLEMIAEEIEDPFGLSDDDLMLDEICRTIDQSVTDILGSSK